MIRKPAVAGRFYPASPAELSSALDSYSETADRREKAVGIVVPHAGYMYSGHVAGAVYSRIDAPARSVILCPNHTGLGTPLSIMNSGAWRTPLGDMPIDAELCDALMAADPHLQYDVEAHRFEHALEVQLPFVQHIAGLKARFVPITVGTHDLDWLQQLGHAIAGVVQAVAPGTLVVASSDMNHYESDEITRAKDRKAVDQILALNPEGLYETVRRENISMCGYGPTISMLTAAKQLGAARAQLVKYATSGDVSLDFDHVVGYAGIIIS
jgi:MEMO1 family protein